MSTHSRGQIRPTQRVTDDVADTLHGDLTIPAEFAALLQETQKHYMNPGTKRDIRNRIKTLIKWIKDKFPAYANVSVIPISKVDQADPNKFFFDGHFKEDLRYTGMNKTILPLFLASIEIKSNDKYRSHGDMQKYFNAFVWASRIKGEHLSVKFYATIQDYLQDYKKEYTNHKSSGKMEDKSCDPIPVSLYKLLLQWALDANNIFVWFWSIAQWNCMARSALINPLHTGNFCAGTDSIIVKYDTTKADKNAERLSEKNIFGNPFDWRCCFWTDLGLWIVIRGDVKMTDNDRIFFIQRCERRNGIL